MVICCQNLQLKTEAHPSGEATQTHTQGCEGQFELQSKKDQHSPVKRVAKTQGSSRGNLAPGRLESAQLLFGCTPRMSGGAHSKAIEASG
jgi:hypothetical protein